MFQRKEDGRRGSFAFAFALGDHCTYVCQAICESFISTFHSCWLGIWVDEICAVLIAAGFYRSIKFGEVFSDVFLTDLCFNKFHGGGFQF